MQVNFGTTCWASSSQPPRVQQWQQSTTAQAISEQEFYAVCVAATPNDFAWLALRMSRHKRQSEPVPDINRSICHDFGAARRDVQYEAFALRHSVVDRHPGRPFVQLPSWFALYLCPWPINSHDDHPSLDLTAVE
jgi:hypothetical protein